MALAAPQSQYSQPGYGANGASNFGYPGSNSGSVSQPNTGNPPNVIAYRTNIYGPGPYTQQGPYYGKRFVCFFVNGRLIFSGNIILNECLVPGLPSPLLMPLPAQKLTLGTGTTGTGTDLTGE